MSYILHDGTEKDCFFRALMGIYCAKLKLKKVLGLNSEEDELDKREQRES